MKRLAFSLALAVLIHPAASEDRAPLIMPRGDRSPADIRPGP